MADNMGFNGSRPTDPFSQFWFDMWAKMSPMGVGAQAPPPNPSDEMLRQFRQAFFDAWGKHCEEYMRSEQFLSMMKHSMDSALAFREQMGEMMTKVLHENQAPARSDTDSILLVLRSMEERVLERIERLNERISNLESEKSTTTPEPAVGAADAKRRPKEVSR